MPLVLDRNSPDKGIPCSLLSSSRHSRVFSRIARSLDCKKRHEVGGVLESFDKSKMSNVSTVLCVISRLKSHLVLGYLVHDVCPYMLGVLSTDDVFYGLTCGKCDTLLLSSANPRIPCTSKNITLTCSKVLGCLGGPAPANED